MRSTLDSWRSYTHTHTHTHKHTHAHEYRFYTARQTTFRICKNAYGERGVTNFMAGTHPIRIAPRIIRSGLSPSELHTR
jgi:hypothetical protein